PRRALRVGLLRPLAQPVGAVMLDVGVRGAGEGACALSTSAGLGVRVRGVIAPLTLVAARARRKPARWLAPAVGIALALAIGGAVAAEGVIAGDRSVHNALCSLSPLDRSVRVTWQGVVTPQVATEARALLSRLGLRTSTEVLLLNPVRLGGVVV